MSLLLSPDQAQAVRTILKWYMRADMPYITLGGYAGTGKTTLITALRHVIRTKRPEFTVAFCAFTGKATQVMATKLQQSSVALPQDSISTIHSLIYQAEADSVGRITGWKKKTKLKADLIIVDEASMVNSRIWNDLLSFNIPILAVGDHGQLPPIDGSFNIMENPQIRLEKIHRQAEGNPIIDLSLKIRTEGNILPGVYGKGVVKYDRTDPLVHEVLQELMEQWNPETLILTGRNKTRVQMNQEIRRLKFRETAEPEVGDLVICVKNNWEQMIYNGMIGTIRHIKDRFDSQGNNLWYEAEIELTDQNRIYQGDILKVQFNAPSTVKEVEGISPREFGDQFDFGYALTVHKAQGSQARKVIVFEERFQKMSDDDWKRWLYTAVTRAEEELVIIG